MELKPEELWTVARNFMCGLKNFGQWPCISNTVVFVQSKPTVRHIVSTGAITSRICRRRCLKPEFDALWPRQL